MAFFLSGAALVLSLLAVCSHGVGAGDQPRQWRQRPRPAVRMPTSDRSGMPGTNSEAVPGIPS